ncbi:MAG: DUF1223 domain-containing protein [Pseudomonadota bacterium]
MSRLSKLAFTTAIALTALTTTAAADPIKGVVEMFTSQGCSSCPPADRVTGELSERDDVLALSWHVDYWDYIGWKDTFASPANTARQYAYHQHRQKPAIYTPQAVINGRGHVVGSRPSDVEGALTDGARKNVLTVNVELVRDDDDDVWVKLPSANIGEGDHSVILVMFDHKSEVEIGRGENRGRTITYHNIVREAREVAMYDGSELTMMVPAELVSELSENRSMAVLVQRVAGENQLGPVVGAAKL